MQIAILSIAPLSLRARTLPSVLSVALPSPSRGAKRARARARADFSKTWLVSGKRARSRRDYPLKIRSKVLHPPPSLSLSLSLSVVGGRGGGVKTLGKTLVSCTRATTDRRRPLCFSNPGFDSRINSPSVHNSFTAEPVRSPSPIPNAKPARIEAISGWRCLRS